MIVSEPSQVAESFDSKLTEHMYQVLKDQGELDECGALKKLYAKATHFSRKQGTWGDATPGTQFFFFSPNHWPKTCGPRLC